jgi:arsenate reductase
LILCTGNSARSILGEALFNHAGNGRFRAYSAGSHPVGKVNPFALEQIARLDTDTSRFRSKSWDEFEGQQAPELDFVITVCGNAANETCPRFPGAPHHIHWGLPDPAAVTDSEDATRAAFAATFETLKARIEAVANYNAQDREQLAEFMRSLANVNNQEELCA